MAWLQNLAGHAEHLLNKIDQNAATVLNEGNKQTNDVEEKGQDYYYKPEQEEEPPLIEPISSSVDKLSRPPTPEENMDPNVVKNSNISLTLPEGQSSGSVAEEIQKDESIKSNHTSVSSNSIHNSFTVSQELEGLQAKIAKLELENQDINKQLLNIQHLYYETRNENTNLQFQVDRLNEQLALAQNEKEQYVARAQRILQKKEELIMLRQTSNNNNENNDGITAYNEELKKELEFQQTKVIELTDKNKKLLNDLQSLQMQHQVIQQGLSQSNQSLERNLLNEKMLRSVAEQECDFNIKELHKKTQEIIQLQEFLKTSKDEISQLKEALSKKVETVENNEVENRMKSLTTTLMLKQNKLETVTTERNALRLQLEKLEAEYRKNIAELKRDRVKIINVEEANDERISVPNFMRVSPHDAGVTRRVKRAYSSLDAISVRTGVFLRRYPLARVFVFSYMVILHVWVLTVLLWYVPSN